MDKLIVSSSPHIHSGSDVRRIMIDVSIALLPALLLSIYVFGLPALIISVVSVVSCVFFEFVFQKYVFKVPVKIQDFSAVVTGLLLAFNLPSSLPVWMVIVGAFVAIVITKLSFGGLGFNIFNPALAARVFLLISFPVQMTYWPKAFAEKSVDTISTATPLGLVKEAGLMGESLQSISHKLPSYTDMFLGFTGGSLGEMSVLALLLGAAYLLFRRIISWHIPVSMLLSMFVVAGIFWLINPEEYMSPVFHILTGGAVLGAFFMATDMVTSPMTKKGMLIFGFAIGLITVMIRLFGAYPEGVSFAILIMNAFVPLIDKYTKPRRFGEKLKVKIL